MTGRPWRPWIIVGAVLCFVSPVLGAIVMWPGMTMWLQSQREDEES